MSIYTVYEAQETAPLRSSDSRQVMRDGFSWFAALLPPVWTLANRLWMELAIWLAGIAGLWLVSILIGGVAVFFLYVLFSVLIGFEAAAIRGGALTRGGWRYCGEVIADGPDLAELAFLQRQSRLRS
jgi:hypothetical protein